MPKNTEKTLADETDILVNRIIERGIDGIIGGFPCQDISFSGTGSGLAGSRSGLFWEMLKTVCMVRPTYWLMENVAALLHRGMGEILGTVSKVGYYAEWDCVGAGTVGAPHDRERIYILAYTSSLGLDQECFPPEIQRQREFSAYNGTNFENFRDRSDVPKPLLCGASNGLAKRLHAIGNGNPPCVIRELTRGLK